jgi:transposase
MNLFSNEAIEEKIRKRKKRKDSRPVFKRYEQDKMMLLPPDVRDFIPEGHIVYVVNETIDGLDIQPLLDTYKGNGTSSYNPRMLLKVIVYAYIMKLYSSRKIAKALREDVTFMWISGMNRPDFRTINSFRSGRLKEVIDEVFTETLIFLIDNRYVKLEKYFIDGTKFRADANKNSYVWRKNTERYKGKVIEKIKELIKQIDAENERENKEYGNKDLEELGEESEVSSEKVREQIKKINGLIKEKLGNKKVTRLEEKIEKKMIPGLEKYEEQERILNGRNSYSKTDKDATFMRDKEDQLLPEYNVIAGTEGQFIVNYSISQNASETNELRGNIEKVKNRTGRYPDSVMGDSTYGSEENYEFMEREGIRNYLKYNTYHIEKTKKHKENKFHRDNFSYDKDTDSYKCPNNKSLKFKEQRKSRTSTGYITESKIYECESCKYCRYAKECKKSKTNRTIQINKKLEYYKEQARKNLESEEGIQLRKERGVDVETVWGDIKKNQGYRRFKLRSLPKVISEFGILSISHNIKKMYMKMIEKTNNSINKQNILKAVMVT